MARLIVVGNGPLRGDVRISGAKNAALPCLAATLLTKDEVCLTNLPPVQDIKTLAQLLLEMGLDVRHEGETAHVTGARLKSHIAPYELVKTMRASILTLGPLIARLGKAQVSLPGGCAIGARPVDLHLKALEKMGATIRLEHGYIAAEATNLHGADILFEKVTVTGTENIMMAASLASGTTILRNAAREPEITDLADMLNKMGAKITGAGSDVIKIEGVAQLHGCEHAIIPDRIETGTYVCAAAITQGHVRVTHANPSHLQAFLESIKSAGLPLNLEENLIEVLPHQGLVAQDIQTQPHPGFPTDMQAQFMAVMTQAVGRSVITENIFENRFNHVPELQRMGAHIKVDGQSAITTGITALSGAQVMATDLRASASLVLAGLVAAEETLIDRIYHLDRGYANLEGKLKALGAKVRRVTTG